ncbi:MAG: ABC transporter substrate-binding protein, partial [Acetobacteraceae bacterium]
MIGRRLALAAALVLGVASLAGAQAQQRLPENRVLRVIPFADLQSLDPITTTVGMTQRHATMIYDVLVARDDNQAPQPQMAERWTVSADNLVWRFTLREGLAFHDGAPVTAEDVVASLRRWAQRDAHGRQIWAVTASLTADDPRTLTWTLTRPYGLMLFALSKPSGLMPAIMPARIAATDPATPITETIGSGPFVFVREEWVPGSRVVYR